MDTYALIDLTDFGSCLNGEHIYADVVMYIAGEHMGSTQITKILTEEEAQLLNEKDGNEVGSGMDLQAGWDSPRFNGKDEAIEHALLAVKDKWPFVKHAFVGRYISNPARCVLCDDEQLMNKFNTIYEQHEECYKTTDDPWQVGLGDKVTQLDKEWNDLLEAV